MNTFKKIVKQNSVILGVLVCALGLVASIAYTSASPRTAHAASGLSGDLHGYAWSSTVGWFSLNCAEGSTVGGSVCSTSNYKVTLDATTQLFSGYAWSSNVGWVSFNPADVSFCGSQASFASGRMTGWARAISSAYTNGADGCISLSPTSGSLYGVTVDSSTGTYSGYAWGSYTIGWVDFSRVTMSSAVSATVDLTVFDPALLTFTNGPLNVVSSTGTGTAQLKWTSTGVSSCSASVSPSTISSATDWSGSVPVSSTSSVVSYSLSTPATYTYKVTCNPTATGSSPISDSIQVIVGGVTSAPYVDLKIEGSSGPTDGPITMPDWSGGAETLLWTSSTDVTSCTASSTPSMSDWSPTTTIGTSSTGTLITLPENTTVSTMTYVYKIQCTGTSVVNDTVLVNVPPTDTPSCAIRPGPYFAPSGTHVHFEVSLNIAWTPTFHSTDFTVDLTGAPGLTATFVDMTTGLPASSITTSAGRLGLMIDGPMPTVSSSIVVNAGPSVSVVGVSSCSPATITIGSSGGTGIRGSFPWQEK